MDKNTQPSNAVTPALDTTQAVDATFEDSSHASLATERPTSTGVSWGFLFNLVFILLLVFATSAGGFYLYQELTIQKQKTAELTQQLQQDLNDPLARITHLEQQQRASEREANNNLSQVKKAQSQLQEQLNKLAQQTPNQWMAEEAKYLVRMAGDKLWLEKDPQTALALLKTADDRIKSMKNPALMPLRKALANDMAAVAEQKTTDIAGTVLTIDSMIDNLNKLQLNRTTIEIASDENTVMSDSLEDWQTNLAKSWKALIEQFVVIRKRTADHAPLLTPDQQWYLVENIRNKLLQAQLSLLRQDEANYRNSIALANKWVYQNFDLKDDKTQQALSALDALAELEIASPTIEQFAATPLLEQLVTHGNLVTKRDLSL